MASRFAAVTNKGISKIINQAVPEIDEEGDEVLKSQDLVSTNFDTKDIYFIWPFLLG